MTSQPETERSCTVVFDGEFYEVPPGGSILIGREGDVRLDDNPYLHRNFLEVAADGDMWWLLNVGSRLAAHVTDGGQALQATLSPGGRLPLLFERTSVTFTAGDHAYHLVIETTAPPFRPVSVRPGGEGGTTNGSVVLTTAQRALIVALAEPLLQREGAQVSEIPSSAAAARRLGWTQTRFNRKLDNVCDKFDAIGVSGLRGSAGRLATQRRARLVEYAVSTRLVTAADLPLLDSTIPTVERHRGVSA